ncbi:heterokaryon incompatibility protein-domain-containing protein [Hypoxylon rubiginosum]|uniref:Heterokaryon incompatibility protein-domain-containing protein n=1 Tax=Hypoxylon rubiginosum TaxID=110542 RepID=A0ACB9ZFA4_9PEZI|nr:heterokaryon incompatibility protein-domain-containing protein [Hypoxylon rubiginosum]
MNYQQLDTLEFEIRLLEVIEAPPEPTALIRFKGTTRKLNHQPEYKALSYCWGDASKRLPIEVNDQIVYISESLVHSLYSVGSKPGDLLWADSICINQDDKIEKANQVRMMHLIYSKAEATIIWLGAEGPNTKYAHALLDNVDRIGAHKFLQRLDLLGERHARPISVGKFNMALRITQHPIRALRGLHELLTMPYWERVWIIQEIARAQAVSVRCGSFRFDLNTLIACSMHLKDLPKRSHTLINAIEEFRRQELDAQRGGLRMTLLEALLRSRYSLATNPRDKIYALLGLTRDGQDLVPTPTYTESLEEVFRQLSMAFLRSPHPIDSVLLSLWAPLKITVEYTPSWVVDWADLAFNVPPWLISNLPGRFGRVFEYEERFGRPTFIEDQVGFPGRGRFLGTITSENDDRTVSVPIDPEIRERSPWILQATVAYPLLRRFLPENPDSMAVPPAELTMALVRLVTRTVDPQVWELCPNKEYMEEVSKHLGQLLINSVSIRTLANECLDYITTLQTTLINRVHGVAGHGGSGDRSEAETNTKTKDRRAREAREARSPNERSRTSNTTRQTAIPPIIKAIQKRNKREAALSSDPTSKENRNSLSPDVRSTRSVSPTPGVDPYMNFMTFSRPSLAAFRVWSDIFAALDLCPEYGLGLASVEYKSSTHFILTPHDTEEGDQIYQLDCCHFPIILRPLSPGRFVVVGEACIGLAYDGGMGHWVAARDCAWGQLSQTGSLALTILRADEDD